MSNVQKGIKMSLNLMAHVVMEDSQYNIFDTEDVLNLQADHIGYALEDTFRIFKKETGTNPTECRMSSELKKALICYINKSEDKCLSRWEDNITFRGVKINPPGCTLEGTKITLSSWEDEGD